MGDGVSQTRQRVWDQGARERRKKFRVILA
jgi:hypothetical protein